MLQRRFSENREWDIDDSCTLRETIELEVECHNGDLSQGDGTMNTYYPQTSSTTVQTIPQLPPQQQPQQPTPQQPIHKPASSSKLKNLPTLSISGPSPPFEEEEIL